MHPTSKHQTYKANTNRSGETDYHTRVVGEFNTSLSTMDKSSRQKITKETLELNYALDQMDLTNTYRTFHPREADTHCSQPHIEDSSGHIICSVTEQVLTNLKRFKTHGISSHNGTKLEIYNKEKLKNSQNYGN